MPNPYSIELRERVVAAYETGEGSFVVLALRFGIDKSTVEHWVNLRKETGSLEARRRGGGWKSPVNNELLERVVALRPDATALELTRSYNLRLKKRRDRVHCSSIKRALKRLGFVFKKNGYFQQNGTVQMSKKRDENS